MTFNRAKAVLVRLKPDTTYFLERVTAEAT
jgi:hypothetical protein